MKVDRHLTASAVAVAMCLGAAGASAQGVQLHAVLSGGNEVSGTTANAGDPDAHGAAAVTFRGGAALTTICMAVVLNRAAKPTLMHIHEQEAGQNGDVVVTFVPPTSGDPGTSGQCVGLSADLSRRIRANPSKFYVNIHNADFPGGAIRGQLF